MEIYVRELMGYFPNSFINYLNELILIDKTNLYLQLDSVKNEFNLKVKVVEYCSRHASKAMPYTADKRNKKYQDEVRNNINKYLKTNFSREDMETIYQELGNGINHELAEQFVKSGYDINLLKDDNHNETVECAYKNFIRNRLNKRY